MARCALCRYALAAAALGQVTFTQAMAHKETVLEVAAAACTEDPQRSTFLGVLYDECCRHCVLFFRLFSVDSLCIFLQGPLGGHECQDGGFLLLVAWRLCR